MKIKDSDNQVQQQERAKDKKADKRSDARKADDGKSFEELLKKSDKKDGRRARGKDAGTGEPLSREAKGEGERLLGKKGEPKFEQKEFERKFESQKRGEVFESRTQDSRKLDSHRQDTRAGAELKSERKETDRHLTETGARADASGKKESADEEMEFRMREGSAGQGLEDSAKQAGQDAAASQRAAGTPRDVAEVRSESARPSENIDPKTKEQIDKIANEMVQKIQVGEDMQKRKVVLMEVEVPGRGEVKIRLRRDGESYDLRMRAKDPEFAETLRTHQDTLRREASSKGMQFSGIQIVG